MDAFVCSVIRKIVPQIRLDAANVRHSSGAWLDIAQERIEVFLFCHHSFSLAVSRTSLIDSTVASA